MREGIFRSPKFRECFGPREDDVGDDVAKQGGLAGAGRTVHSDNSGLIGQMGLAALTAACCSSTREWPPSGRPTRGQGRTYTMSGALYRQLGQKVEHVRQTGFEPEQQRQMVLKYVREHGAIRRAEAAQLCGMSEDQAKLLLTALVTRTLSLQLCWSD